MVMVEDAVETALKTDRAVMGGERTTTATPAMAVAGAPGVVEPVKPVETVETVETMGVGMGVGMVAMWRRWTTATTRRSGRRSG